MGSGQRRTVGLAIESRERARLVQTALLRGSRETRVDKHPINQHTMRMYGEQPQPWQRKNPLDSRETWKHES
jgi:hypothetical protein